MNAANNPGTGDTGFFTFRPADTVAGTQINVASGNALIHTRDLADGPLTYHVVVDRAYNSLASDDFSILSPRWKYDVGPDTKLTVEANQDATVAGPSGYRIRFARQSDGSYVAPDDFDGALTKNPNGWTLTRASQNDEFGFDGSGNLTWTKDGELRDFTVQGTSAAGRTVLSSYGTSSGRRVNLSYNGDSLVRLMDDPASGHHWYRYTNGRLTEYENPLGQITTYAYDGNGFLDEIVEPGGTTVELEVLSSGRITAITTTLPGGVPQTTSFTYTRRNYKTDVTAPDTTRRTYAYDDDWRVTRDYDPDVVPTVTASGELRNLADNYTRGLGTVAVQLAASGPDGSGLTRLAVESVDVAEIAAVMPLCVVTPFDRACPQAHSADTGADLSALPEGRHALRAVVHDDENHVATSESWAVLIDRTGPAFVGTVDAVQDEGDGIADLSWSPTSDPSLPSDDAGSGFDHYEVRARPEGGAWPAYETVPDDIAPALELGPHAVGDRIEYEIRAYDKLGNVSTAAGTTTVVLTDVTAGEDGDFAPGEAEQPLGPLDEGESDEWRDVDPDDDTELPAPEGHIEEASSASLSEGEAPSIALLAVTDYDRTLCARDGLLSPCGQYSGRKAGAYARRWAHARSPEYDIYKSDCTNFASQVLHFGGMRFTRTAPGINDPRHGDIDLYSHGPGSWWSHKARVAAPPGPISYHRRTRSWSVGWVLYSQLVEHGLARVLGSNERMRTGDIAFYWWEGRGAINEINHVNVIANVRKREVFIAQHTNDRYESTKLFNARARKETDGKVDRIVLRPIATRFDLP